MNTIHIELPGIEAKLDRIIELLEKQTTHDCSKCAESVAFFTANQLQQGQAPAEEAQPTVDTTPEEKPAEAQETAKTEPEQPTVDRADIQKKVVELSAAGKKADVKKIVTDYATKVSDIPEDKLAEVWQKLTKLEG